MTIPWLELLAADLLSRLMEAVCASLNHPKFRRRYWTDSEVVREWLSQHPSKWKTFVSHRVAAIQSRTPYAEWHHVPTKDNPADCASRGLLGTNFESNSLWWHGPDWLRLEPFEWPINLASSSEDVAQTEAKSISVNIAQAKESWDLASRYSTWPKLLRVTAYVIRFVHRCRNQSKQLSDLPSSKALTANDYQKARLFWLQTIQAEIFSEELRALQQKRPLSSKGAIISLNPFVDGDKLIRVGGRIERAPLPFCVKHPILLAPHSVVQMIVRDEHVRSMHAGVQLTLATLRRKFWILRARNMVKRMINRCVTCAREKAAIPTQLMGPLPRARVSAPSRPFLHCGVDYAGPIATRASAGRGITSRKSYIAVFICLVTRAMHLELVGSYSTSAFLDAYTRFRARRGLPEAMYSDNGTTFTGADTELTIAYRKALQDPDFLSRTASDQVTWHFIPPHAPHFGGLWEAGVRSIKHHLRRVIGSHTLTFEELTTLLCKIEACLNSRPLGALTDSFDDYDPLTPGHFLIGAAITAIPEPSVLHIQENRLSRWQLIRHITERFWKIWQTDYVNTLQQRVKWRKAQPSIKVGSMVLVRNSTLPPCKWELGRVIRCHEGSDGLVRVVSVKTAKSEYKRPLAQLCLLPIDIESQRDDASQTPT
ncbi:uncharacterized protein [Temnothorax nylanderi]|uniref:uncharacterized protein n=1 Tax=Temnothorax nylanderi TaxID=102681 RepID=UPI003A8848B7